MKIPVYNSEGKVEESLSASDYVFAVPAKETVVHQVYEAMQANQREPWAHTKDRGDVRGGGKKPWKQKGTGRARHGSIRSPIWRGGGVTFGPLNVRNYKQKINAKMNRLAVRMCLSDKVREEKLLVVSGFNADGKTKTVAKLRQVLPGKGKSMVFLTGGDSKMIMRAVGNIQKFDVQRAVDVNVADLVQHQYVMTTKDGVEALEKRLGKK